eukprot:jgi/Chrzof1/6554/Cz19g00260.t1
MQAATTSLDCSQKMVITLAVDNGDTVASQQLQFNVQCIGRDLLQPVVVQITKSPLYASYPLTYLQSFNYKPYESITRPGPGNCKDGAYDTAPTCGWYYASGQQLADSQGFCCQCSPGQIWDSTLGQNTQKSRGGIDCDFFTDPLDILLGRYPSSAHCLNFDPQWYGGYKLGEATLQFQIIITITMLNATSGLNSTETLSVSPSVPLASSSGRTMTINLLGDLAGYTQLPVLSSKLLMIPRPLTNQTLDDVLGDKSNWMLVDTSLVSYDGQACDKVGTSFGAFRNQANGCKRAPQVCLTNQLKDLRTIDSNRIALGQVPLYLVAQYTYGTSSDLKAFDGGPLSFALPVTGKRNSLITLAASADSLRFVVNASPGKISKVKCGGFEALAASGYLQANITNTGVIPASYTLSVTNCSINIAPVPAQKLAILAGDMIRITPFQITVSDDSGQTDRYCWLVLYDSQALITDHVKVVFFTNATAYGDVPAGGPSGDGTGAGTDAAAKACSEVCSNTLDMLCFVKYKCWSKFGGFLGLLGGLLLGAALLFLAFKYGLITSLFSALLSMCCGCGSSSKAKRRSGKRLTDEHTKDKTTRPSLYTVTEPDTPSDKSLHKKKDRKQPEPDIQDTAISDGHSRGGRLSLRRHRSEMYDGYSHNYNTMMVHNDYSPDRLPVTDHDHDRQLGHIQLAVLRADGAGSTANRLRQYNLARQMTNREFYDSDSGIDYGRLQRLPPMQPSSSRHDTGQGLLAALRGGPSAARRPMLVRDSPMNWHHNEGYEHAADVNLQHYYGNIPQIEMQQQDMQHQPVRTPSWQTVYGPGAPHLRPQTAPPDIPVGDLPPDLAAMFHPQLAAMARHNILPMIVEWGSGSGMLGQRVFPGSDMHSSVGTSQNWGGSQQQQQQQQQQGRSPSRRQQHRQQHRQQAIAVSNPLFDNDAENDRHMRYQFSPGYNPSQQRRQLGMYSLPGTRR